MLFLTSWPIRTISFNEVQNDALKPKPLKTLLSFTLGLLMCSINAFTQPLEEKVLYIVDSIPILSDSEEGLGTLTHDVIQEIQLVSTKALIEQRGFSNVDKLIILTTKAYFNRPPEVKKIPTTKAMEQKEDGRWYLKNSSVPYTGPFIDYFLNGNKQGEGFLKNGLAYGLRAVYFSNGHKSFYRNYADSGIAEGEAAAFFNNGQIKNRGNFKQGKEDGIWREWYSTGKLKRETSFKNGEAFPTKNEEAFHSFLGKASKLYKNGDLPGAVSQLDKAIVLNPEYSDAYFERGTIKLNDFKFDDAIIDFDKTLELEPLSMKALTNRAFARLRKHQFKNSRTLSKADGVTILASKDKVDIPEDELRKICADLNKSYEMGERKKMVLQAIEDYCK